MKRSSRGIWRVRTVPRRWLAPLLLVLYVAAVHGLPALHLGWHKDDHVHELSGLRRLAARHPAHTHDHRGAHPAPEAAPQKAAPLAPDRRSTPPRLRADQGTSSLASAPHLGLGPAHGQLSLLAPGLRLALLILRPAHLLTLPPLSARLRSVSARPRARAPPALI